MDSWGKSGMEKRRALAALLRFFPFPKKKKAQPSCLTALLGQKTMLQPAVAVSFPHLTITAATAIGELAFL